MSQSIVQPFNFKGNEVRVLSDAQGTPWFVAKDVCDVLGYSNSRKAVSDHVDDEDKGVTICYTPGGEQQITTINESGLYSLVLSSKMPDAKKFKRWVTNDVLPSIRKHGAYMTDQTIERTLTDPDYLIRLATAMKEERAKRLEAERMVEEQKPKVLFADAVAASKSSVLIGELAKILTQNGYEIGQNRLFKWLRDNHYLGTVGEQWNLPRQRYVEQGLFEIRKRMVQNPDGTSRTTRTTLVTGKGQQYFVQKFLANTGKEAV